MSARGMTERARRAVREVEEVLAQAGTDEARTMADALRRALLRAVWSGYNKWDKRMRD